MTNRLFSCLKISCFFTKAHLVYHWCLYNKKSIFLVKYWAKYIPCWRVTVSFIGPTSLYCDPLFVCSSLAFTLDTIAVLCHSSPSGSSLISKIWLLLILMWKSIAVRYAPKVKQFTQSKAEIYICQIISNLPKTGWLLNDLFCNIRQGDQIYLKPTRYKTKILTNRNRRSMNLLN